MALGAFYAVKHGSRAMSVVSEDKPVAKGSIVLTVSHSQQSNHIIRLTVLFRDP